MLVVDNVFMYYRFQMSIWFHCTSSVVTKGYEFDDSHSWGHDGRHLSTSTEVYWLQSSAWDCTEWMGVILWVRCLALHL